MALLRRVFLVLLASMAIAAGALIGNEQGPAIPVLPEAETRANNQAFEHEKTENVVTFQDEKAPSFSDRLMTRGTLNALDLSGYFRVRFNYFRNGHLRTYIPKRKQGTSLLIRGINAFFYSRPSINPPNLTRFLA